MLGGYCQSNDLFFKFNAYWSFAAQSNTVSSGIIFNNINGLKITTFIHYFDYWVPILNRPKLECYLQCAVYINLILIWTFN